MRLSSQHSREAGRSLRTPAVGNGSPRHRKELYNMVFSERPPGLETYIIEPNHCMPITETSCKTGGAQMNPSQERWEPSSQQRWEMPCRSPYKLSSWKGCIWVLFKVNLNVCRLEPRASLPHKVSLLADSDLSFTTNIKSLPYNLWVEVTHWLTFIHIQVQSVGTWAFLVSYPAHWVVGQRGSDWGTSGPWGREEKFRKGIYLQHLVILLSQHGSIFNWTGTDSSVLRWFYNANMPWQLCLIRLRRGFCGYACTKLSLLGKLSLIWWSLNRRVKGI